MKRALAAVALLALTGCAAKPAPKAPDLTASVNAVYDVAYTMFTARYDDEALGRYVREVGDRIAAPANRRISFVVTNEADVSANALPGGTVRVSRGALVALGSEAELAALLGHEVAHVALGHSAESLWARLHDVSTSPDCWSYRSIDEQLQADQRGISLMIAAGYDPRAAPRMLRRVYDVSSEGEADRAEARVRLAHMARKLAGATPAGETGADRYLDHLDGVVFGNDTRKGTLIGRTITSERDGLAFDVPEGASTEGALPALAIDARGRDAKLALVMIPSALEGSLLGALVDELEKGPHTKRRIDDITVFLGQTKIKDRDTPTMIITARGAVWMAIASGDEGDAVLRAMEATVRRARDAPRPPPPARVRVRRTKARMRFADAMKEVCRGDRTPHELGLWNGFAPEEEIPAGTRIKCVER